MTLETTTVTLDTQMIYWNWAYVWNNGRYHGSYNNGKGIKIFKYTRMVSHLYNQ
jgi:hypothetical protein